MEGMTVTTSNVIKQPTLIHMKEDKDTSVTTMSCRSEAKLKQVNLNIS